MNIENMKIISIDDNKTNLLIMESYAKILKLDISSFLNPLEAVEELEKNDYDLIIVDNAHSMDEYLYTIINSTFKELLIMSVTNTLIHPDSFINKIL